MATSQALEVQEKKELVSREEKTVPARYFVPTTDIFETADALTVVMELPGVDKEALDVNIENDVLRVEGRIDHSKYEGMDPLYTEYKVGYFARSFTLSNKIDQQQIGAHLEDGVLTLTLKKAKEPCRSGSRSAEKKGGNSAARSALTVSRERQVVSTKVSPPPRCSLDDESAMPPHGALAVSAVPGRRLKPGSSDDIGACASGSKQPAS